MEVSSNIWSESMEMIVWAGGTSWKWVGKSGSQRGSEILIEEGMVHHRRAWSVLGTMLKERSWPETHAGELSGPVVQWGTGKFHSYLVLMSFIIYLMVKVWIAWWKHISDKVPKYIVGIQQYFKICFRDWVDRTCLDLILDTIWYEISPFVCFYSLIRKPAFKLNTQELQRHRTVTY